MRKQHRWTNRAYRLLTRFTEASVSSETGTYREIPMGAYGSWEITQGTTEKIPLWDRWGNSQPLELHSLQKLFHKRGWLNTDLSTWCTCHGGPWQPVRVVLYGGMDQASAYWIVCTTEGDKPIFTDMPLSSVISKEQLANCRNLWCDKTPGMWMTR